MFSLSLISLPIFAISVVFLPSPEFWPLRRLFAFDSPRMTSPPPMMSLSSFLFRPSNFQGPSSSSSSSFCSSSSLLNIHPSSLPSDWTHSILLFTFLPNLPFCPFSHQNFMQKCVFNLLRNTKNGEALAAKRRNWIGNNSAILPQFQHYGPTDWWPVAVLQPFVPMFCFHRKFKGHLLAFCPKLSIFGLGTHQSPPGEWVMMTLVGFAPPLPPNGQMCPKGPSKFSISPLSA